MGLECCGNCQHAIDTNDWCWSDLENDIIWYPEWMCDIDLCTHSHIHSCNSWIHRKSSDGGFDNAMANSHTRRMEKML